MSLKLRNPMFKVKHFVNVVGKFRFAELSGDTVLPSFHRVGGLKQFLRIRCPLAAVSLTPFMSFSTVQCVFISEHRFGTPS
jgi:hypothetical protein